MACVYADESGPAEKEKLVMWEMPTTVSLPSQEELGCGSHVPIAIHNRTGTSFMATGGKPAYLGKDVGR